MPPQGWPWCEAGSSLLAPAVLPRHPKGSRLVQHTTTTQSTTGGTPSVPSSVRHKSVSSSRLPAAPGHPNSPTLPHPAHLSSPSGRIARCLTIPGIARHPPI